jgi:hypothetical protein
MNVLFEILAPRAQVDAGQDDLLRPTVQRGAHVGNDPVDGARAPGAARQGGDTEGAAIVATVLDLNESACAAVQAGQPLARQRFQIKKLLRKAKQVGDQVILLRVGNDPADTGEASRPLRLERDPATGGNHPTGPQTLCAADGGA